MDSDSDNVAETEKYAFLLGSALRNEDPAQFFSVYDSILPSDLPDSQVSIIKDKAREIADLPEDQFNHLVSRALSFSLAPAGKTMSYTPASGSRCWSYTSDNEDEGVGGSTRQLGSKSESSSQYSYITAKASVRSSESDARRYEDDSGLCNSSKATNSIGSLSDRDASDSDDRHFDYFPSQIKIRSGCGLFADYDEAHEVQSEPSSQDVNSPRSEISDDMGRELDTFHTTTSREEFSARQQAESNDFSTDEDSDDGLSHRKPPYLGYSRYERHSPLQYQYKPKFETSRDSWDGNKSTSILRSSKVDDKIQFSGLGFSRHQYDTPGGGISSSSDKVRIEQNTYQKPTSKHKHKPPFGQGIDQLDKVGNSIESLIKDFPGGEVKDMPAARKLVPLKSEDTKKKKKKKRGKDDSVDRYEKNTDENGNPVENQPFDHSTYRQMRESPNSSQLGVNSVSKNLYQLGTTDSHHELQSAGSDTTYSSKDLENGSSKTVKKSLKKKSKEKVQRAEDISNYQGNKSIDELVDFIDGGNNDAGRKSGKLSHTNSQDIPDKHSKTAKKGKDKKQKTITSSTSVGEKDLKGENSSETTSTEQESGNNMGNSGAKSECNTTDGMAENGHVEDIYCENEKVKKDSLLKVRDRDNDKKLPCPVSAPHNNPNKTTTTTTTSSSVPSKDSDVTGEMNKEKKEIQTDPSAVTVESKKKMGKNGKANVKCDRVNTPVLNCMTEEKNTDSSATSSSMSVKQKNVKNNKSKPSSPITKEEPSSPQVSLKEIHDDTSVFNSITDSPLVDNNFIFTDIDVQHVPQEDEFRQVIGKKKKKGTKDSPSQNHYVGGGTGNGTASSNKTSRYHEDKRSAAASRGGSSNSHTNNKIQPTFNAAIPAAINADARTRDLSPSAFPALGDNTKPKQSCQDGRRNSTGEVPIPSEVTVKLQDDSDIESVKSLPATQSGRSDSMLSPRPHMSYAKMAASPKPPLSDYSASPEKESTSETGVDDSERKVPVFKGSPTERRHSIGSSPNGKRGVSEPTSPGLPHKTASQEHLLVEQSANKSDSSVTLGVQHKESAAADTVCKPSKSSNVPAEGGVAQPDKNVNLTVNHKVAKVGTSLGVSPQPVKPQDLPSKPFQSSDINNRKVMQDASVTLPDATKNSNYSERKHVSASSRISNSKSVNHKHELPKTVSKTTSPSYSSTTTTTTTTTNNRKLKPKSSVIFLGNFNEAPENLGITFGFEIGTDKDKAEQIDMGSTAGPACQQLHSVNSVSRSSSSRNSCSTGGCDYGSGVTFSGDILDTAESISNSNLSSISHVIPPPVSVVESSPQAATGARSGVTAGAPSSVPAPALTSSSAAAPPASMSLSGTEKNASKNVSHHVGKLNGVVSSITQGLSGSHSDPITQIPTKSKSPVNKGVTPPHPAMASAPASVSSINGENFITVGSVEMEVSKKQMDVVVYFGEQVLSSQDQQHSQPGNGPTSFCGYVNYRPEGGDIRGQFNVAEAVSFLRREWDKVSQLKEKDPGLVTVHAD